MHECADTRTADEESLSAQVRLEVSKFTAKSNALGGNSSVCTRASRHLSPAIRDFSTGDENALIARIGNVRGKIRPNTVSSYPKYCALNQRQSASEVPLI